jgi:hypothetical protein
VTCRWEVLRAKSRGGSRRVSQPDQASPAGRIRRSSRLPDQRCGSEPGRAADTYVLASAEKIGAVSAYKVLDTDAVTGIVTDGPTDSDIIEELRRLVPTVIPSR